MNTVYKIPVSKLPVELRGDFSGDTVVKVTVAPEDEVFAGFTKAELDKELAQSFRDKEAGLGVTFATFQEMRNYFAKRFADIDKKYQTQ